MNDRGDLVLFQFPDDPAAAVRLLQTGIAAEFQVGTPAIVYSPTSIR